MIYMDNAATTAVYPAVIEMMMPYLNKYYSNPSGGYSFSKKVRSDIEYSRKIIANTIGAKPEEIYFTSGGTESDNWAIKMAAIERGRGKIISSNVEHKAILNSLEWVENLGFKTEYAKVNRKGFVTAEEIENKITNDTILVSVMTANNEIGTIMPLKSIALKNNLKNRGIIFHTDAVQAYGHIPINVNDLNVDMLSASGHKFGAPKGVGFLYIRKNTLSSSLITGGQQEMGLRAGTENVASIVGMAKAAQISMENMNKAKISQEKVRDYMIGKILYNFRESKLNGSQENRLPNNINICFHGKNGFSLITALDKMGICASAGSACASASSKPSHVLLAIGLSPDDARSSVRFTINADTTVKDVDYVISALKHII